MPLCLPYQMIVAMQLGGMQEDKYSSWSIFSTAKLGGYDPFQKKKKKRMVMIILSLSLSPSPLSLMMIFSDIYLFLCFCYMKDPNSHTLAS